MGWDGGMGWGDGMDGMGGMGDIKKCFNNLIINKNMDF